MAIYFSYKPIPSAAEFIAGTKQDETVSSENFTPEFEGNISAEYTGQVGNGVYSVAQGFYLNSIGGNSFYAARLEQSIGLRLNDTVVDNILEQGQGYEQVTGFRWEFFDGDDQMIYQVPVGQF